MTELASSVLYTEQMKQKSWYSSWQFFYNDDLVYELYSFSKLRLSGYVGDPILPKILLGHQSSSTLVAGRFFPVMETECSRSMKTPFLVQRGHHASVMLRISGI